MTFLSWAIILLSTVGAHNHLWPNLQLNFQLDGLDLSGSLPRPALLVIWEINQLRLAMTPEVIHTITSQPLDLG
jgi:hypothetical protein